MRDLEETNRPTPSAQASIEKVRRAHGTLDWQSIQDNLMIRVRYTQAVDEFLNS
jgi:hypothetical protein